MCVDYFSLVSSNIPGEQLFTMNSSPPSWPLKPSLKVRGEAYRAGTRIGECSRGQEVLVFFLVFFFLRVLGKL